MRSPHAHAALLVGLLVTAPPTHAQSATAGIPVAATHLAAESQASILADGSGGAYVGFKIAYRSPSAPAEIAVARVTASGGRNPDWTALPMTPAGSLQQSNPPGPSRIVPTSGGNVLAFADFSNTSSPHDIVREVSPSGAAPGFPGFVPTYTYNVLTAVPRSDGGALILSKTTTGTNVLATIVSAAGTGTEVLTPLTFGSFTTTVGGDAIVAVPSGVNGAIAVMMFPFVGGATGIDIVAVRVDATGVPVWPSQYAVVANAINDQRDQVAISDDADGVIVAWKDSRSFSTGPDIFAGRILASGGNAPGWTGGGKSICIAAGSQEAPAIASDGAGGAWIAWQDARNVVTAGEDLYFTHVLASGAIAAGFAANGRALCGADSDQTTVRLAPDGSGGLFAAWLDGRAGQVDLYATHLDSSGNRTAGWIAGGNAVCTNSAPQAGPALGLVSPGRAIVAWNDARTGTDIVYAAALDAVKGVLDVPRPAAGRLALAPGSNPARGGLELRIDAPGAGDVRVTLFDVAGRVLAERVVSGPARSASLRFDGLRPGLYLARASQAGSGAITRVAVLE